MTNRMVSFVVDCFWDGLAKFDSHNVVGRLTFGALFSLAPDELFSSEPISILATNRYVRWGKPIGAFWAVKR